VEASGQQIPNLRGGYGASTTVYGIRLLSKNP
jgi:hypothetical protein